MEHPVIELGRFLASLVDWIFGSWVGTAAGVAILLLAICYAIWAERVQDRFFERHFRRRSGQKQDGQDDA